MEKFLEIVTTVNGKLNAFAWGPVMLALLIGTGVYLSFRTGFIQVRWFGYIMKNTIGSLFTKKDAVENTIVIANKNAVTLFNKRGVEVEQDRDGDIRQNTIWSRKYFLPALTDATKAVKITIG